MAESTERIATTPARAERSLALDRFRGALVILMVAGNYLAGIGWVPAFLKHAPDIGLTVADLVAPAFVFAIALTYTVSFQRHGYRHVLVRYLSLIGIGAIITAGAGIVGEPEDWGVLQALGVAGLLTLATIRLAPGTRLLVALGLLAAYQLVLDRWLLDDVLASSHGGLFGAVSWGALLIMSTVMADAWRRGATSYAAACVVMGVLALASAAVVPVSKNRVSLSYILLSVVVSAVGYWLVELGSRRVPARAGLDSWWGENPLLLYLMHLVLLGLVELSETVSGAPGVGLAAVHLLLLLTVLSLVAWRLHEHGRRVRL